MRKTTRLAALAAVFALGLGGCYHATVDTGLRPSAEGFQKDWAHSFLYGLVPPSTVETATECPNGVAQVETQLSFLNQLASFLTGGLYTPMTITVTCAAPVAAAELIDAQGNGLAAASAAVHAAALRSQEIEQPVFVRFSSAE